jgi:light-regulated signal transduction histidine kinase (bacteriophytochrome)
MRTGDLSLAETPPSHLSWPPVSETSLQEWALESRICGLEEFAYTAAHDLQEPLRAVTSYVRLAVQRYGPGMDPRALELLQLAASGASRMEDLIEAALASARDPSGDARRLIGSGEAVAGAIANLRPLIQEREAAIRIGRLPRVLANPVQLVRIFQNLIANAIRHGSGERVEVSVECVERARDWLFSVADNGIGIRGRMIPGLGLQICARIAAQHGGRLWSEPSGRGAVLCFTLSKG